MKEDSIVRENLMTKENYYPYCGADCCTHIMPRTKWNVKLKQFVCSCGWISMFPSDFIKRYRKQWSK